MKQYQNEAEEQQAHLFAQGQIMHFLEHVYSYTQLMTITARAQLQIMEIICNVEQDDMHKVIIDDIHEFFYFAIQAFELLKPFTEDETGIV